MATTLPLEILDLILGGLDEIPDRLRLLGVCRHWNTALRSTVYSRLEFSDTGAAVPRCLADGLLKNPQLQPLVHELCPTNTYYGDDADERGFYNRDLFDELLREFMDSDDERATLEEKLDMRDDYAWLAVLLLLVPNLQHLVLPWFSESDYGPVLWIVDKIASRSPEEGLPLHNFQKLSVEADPVKENFFVDIFIPFLKLPSMRTLDLLSVHDDDHGGPYEFGFDIPMDLKPGMSQLREMSFRSSNFEHGLSEFLSACACLESFKYQHSNQVEWGEAYKNYRCRVFREGLLSQKKSLRVLCLNDMGVTKFRSEDAEEEELQADMRLAKEQAWFGSLDEFVVLESLSIPVRNLLDSTDGEDPSMSLDKVLPGSLQALTLTKVDYVEYSMLEGQLNRLLDCRETRFPQLNKIQLQPFQLEVFGGEMQWDQKNWGVPELAKTTFADVASRCKMQSVQFNFTQDGDHVIMADGKVVVDTDGYTGNGDLEY